MKSLNLKFLSILMSCVCLLFIGVFSYAKANNVPAASKSEVASSVIASYTFDTDIAFQRTVYVDYTWTVIIINSSSNTIQGSINGVTLSVIPYGMFARSGTADTGAILIQLLPNSGPISGMVSVSD
jgi:hypothetical protein